MPAYIIADTLLDQPERYEQYKLLAKAAVEKFGGEFVVRGGAIDLKESDLWSPTRIVVVRFPDLDSVKRFYDSPDYQAALSISKETSRRTLFFVEGV